MRYIKFLTPFVLALVVLLVLFSRIETHEVYKVFEQGNKGLLFLSLLVILVAHILTALRWRVMLKTIECNIDLRTCLRLFFANLPIAKIVPLYGGEFLRTYYLKDRLSIARHAGVIFAGMVLDVLTLAVLSFFGGLILGMSNVYVFGLITGCGLIVFLALLIMLKKRLPIKLKSKLESFLYVFHVASKQPGNLFEVITLTLAIWFFVFSYIQVTFLAFSASVPFLAILTIQPVVTLVSLLPITVWGIGTRETVMVFLFRGFADVTVIFAVGLAYSFVGAVLMPALFLPLTYRTWRELRRESSFSKK